MCGHYQCGAVKAALQLPSRTPGLVNCWISDIREARNRAAGELAALDTEERAARLCELNVLRQVFHVCTSPVVQEAWGDGQELHVWGVRLRGKGVLIVGRWGVGVCCRGWGNASKPTTHTSHTLITSPPTKPPPAS